MDFHHSPPFLSQDWVANLRGLGSSNLLRRILGPVMCTTSVAVVVYLASALLMPQVEHRWNTGGKYGKVEL